MLLEEVRRLRLGNGLASKTNVGHPVIQAAQVELAKNVEIGKNEGAKLPTGSTIPANMKACFFDSTFFTDCTRLI
jgi:acyl-CoA reductase-like NAD-dependent aldehyde dehydrogenase